MSCIESPRLLLIKFYAKWDFVQLGYPLKHFHTIEVPGHMVLLYLIPSETVPLLLKRMMLGEESMMIIKPARLTIMLKLK